MDEPRRYILIGDVHGCAAELEELLKLVEWNADLDDVTLLGDLVDRGPDPKAVVDFARRTSAQCPRFHVIRGNHDDKHARYRGHRVIERVTGRRNPMRMSPKALAEHDKYTDEDIAYLASLPLYRAVSFDEFQQQGFYAVHAGFLPDVPIHEQTLAVCTRLRYLEQDDDGEWQMASLEPGNFGKPAGSIRWPLVWSSQLPVFYGHAVYDLESPTIDARPRPIIGLDTGACFGGRLTAAIVTRDDRPGSISGCRIEFASVKARDSYASHCHLGEK